MDLRVYHSVPHVVAHLFWQSWKSYEIMKWKRVSRSPVLILPWMISLLSGLWEKTCQAGKYCWTTQEVHRNSLSYGNISRIVRDFRSSKNPARAFTIQIQLHQHHLISNSGMEHPWTSNLFHRYINTLSDYHHGSPEGHKPITCTMEARTIFLCRCMAEAPLGIVFWCGSSGLWGGVMFFSSHRSIVDLSGKFLHFAHHIELPLHIKGLKNDVY